MTDSGSHLSNEELLARYRRSDLTGFDLFYRRNHKLIFNFLLSRLGSRADAEEAFQDTFMRIHKAIITYDPDQKALPWVFTIARNAAVDIVRRRRSHLSDSDVAEPSFEPATEVTIAAREVLNSLVVGLSLEERSLLESRFLNEESYDEIAARLRIKADVVRQRVSRLIKKIKGLKGVSP